MNSIIKLSLTLSFFFLTLTVSNGQTKSTTQIGDLNCETICSKNYVNCHYYKAMYLLKGLTYSQATPCVNTQLSKFDDLAVIPRKKLGIEELGKVILNPYGLSLTLPELKIILADAKLALSTDYLRSGEFTAAGHSMQEASEIYISLIPKEVESEKSKDFIVKLAFGLIQSNKHLDALILLDKLPLNDSNRAYLSAEALFSLGNRKLASEKYEMWITLGCKSDILMITDVLYGEDWAFLLSTEPPNLTRCEQLPAELRSRFETLKQQFKHPNNIPVRNFPGVLFLNRTR